MRKEVIFLFSIIFLVGIVSAFDFDDKNYGLKAPGPKVIVFDNNTGFVNSSLLAEIWRTNAGDLDDVNLTQMEESDGQLNILESWLDSILLRIDGSNANQDIDLQGFDLSSTDAILDFEVLIAQDRLRTNQWFSLDNTDELIEFETGTELLQVRKEINMNNNDIAGVQTLGASQALIGTTLTLENGAISDSGGIISFLDEILKTEGDIEIDSDSSELKFGASGDGTIGHDGNSFNITSGVGSVNIKGNLILNTGDDLTSMGINIEGMPFRKFHIKGGPDLSQNFFLPRIYIEGNTVAQPAIEMSFDGTGTRRGLIRLEPEAVDYTSLSFWTKQDTFTEKMRLDEDGFLGLDTIAPLSRLHIVDSDNTRLLIQEKTGTTGDTAGLYFKTSSNRINQFFKSGMISLDTGASNVRNDLYIGVDTAENTGNVLHTDMQIKINGVSGNVTIKNDLDVQGNFTGNQIYGEIASHNDTDFWIVPIASQGVWVNVSINTTDSEFAQDNNGFSYTESCNCLIAQATGKYDCSYDGSAGNQGNNQEYQFSLAVNDVLMDINTDSHRKIGAQGDVGDFSDRGWIDLSIGDRVNFQARNNDGTSDLLFHAASINCVRIGK